MTRGGKQQRQLIDGDASSSSSSSSSVSPTSSTSFAWNSGAVDNNNNNNVSRSRDHLLQAFRNDACRRIFPIPFPNFTFVTNTLSFLYTKDLRLREARIVPTEKVFCLRVSVESMKYLKNQSKMVTASMLDTPFLFIERHDDDDDSIGGEGGGGKRRREEVDAYCLSYPGWDPSSAAANNVDADCVFPSLSIDDLSDNAFMRRIEDEEIVWQAYQAFLLCPMVNMICEYKGTAEEQQEHALSCCTAAVEKLMQTKQDVDFEAEMDELLGNDAYFVCKKDSRRAWFPLDCTLATYSERFGREGDDGSFTMGQMMLDSVVNIMCNRCVVPVEGINLRMLLSKCMKAQRVHCIGAQHQSRILLRRSEEVACTTHRFAEGKLDEPVSEYESMGWAAFHFRTR